MSTESFERPSNTEQFKTDYAALIVEAKAKAEGVLLYAPIPNHVKQELFTRVNDVPTEDSEGLRVAFRDQNMAPEQQASLWVDRWLRNAVERRRSELGEGNYEMLTLALNKLYAEDSGHFNDDLAEWMDSGRKPPPINN